MLESALTLKNVSTKRKIAYKTLILAGLIALAVILPQIVHLALGMPGGVKWLPMYLPVLIGGCLLGSKWGLIVGIFSPVVSFLITSAAGNPMPAAERLGFMMAELAVFAFISGLFTKKIYKNGLWAFAAVISAQITGRASFLALVAIFQKATSLTPKIVWAQIQTGFIGLAVQAVIVPLIIIALRALLLKDKKND